MTGVKSIVGHGTSKWKKKKQGALTRDNLTRKNSQILAVAPDQLTLIEI